MAHGVHAFEPVGQFVCVRASGVGVAHSVGERACLELRAVALLARLEQLAAMACGVAQQLPL